MSSDPSVPRKEEARRTQELKLEEEKKRVRAELGRIRNGGQPSESAGAMGVVTSSLQGTRVASPNNDNNNGLPKEVRTGVNKSGVAHFLKKMGEGS